MFGRAQALECCSVRRFLATGLAVGWAVAAAQSGPVRLDLTPANALILSGGQQQFAFSRRFFTSGPAQGGTLSAETAHWSSSNPAVATIDAATGLASGVGDGTTTISVQSGPFQASIPLAVRTALPPLDHITITPQAPVVALGRKQQFVATGYFVDSSIYDLTSTVSWTSSVPGTANISSSGLAITLAQGSTMIQAAAGGQSDAITLTVGPHAVDAIVVAPTAPVVLLGTTQAFTAQANYSDGILVDVSSSAAWSSSDASIATVAAGVLAPLRAGSMQVTAMFDSVTGSAPAFVTQTYETNSELFIRSLAPGGMNQIGLLKAWGGSIIEASQNGVNFVNHDDPGRQIQVSMWDGNADYTFSWGWNPVQAGSSSFIGSPLLAQALHPDSLYIKTQPQLWVGPGLGQAYIEQWVSPAPGHPEAFLIHYQITYFDPTERANQGQELPVMYVNANLTDFIYYSGNAPWSGDAVTHYVMPSLGNGGSGTLYAPEYWAAYADASGVGLTLYAPGRLPFVGGFDAGVTKNLTPVAAYSWSHRWAGGTNFQFDFYVIPGEVNLARSTIYELHATLPNITYSFTPLIALDSPPPGATLAGAAEIAGWAVNVARITNIQAFVDGVAVTDGSFARVDRPDILPCTCVPVDVGFSFQIDTTRLSNGPHSLVLTATDANGNMAVFPTRMITIQN